MTEKITCMTDWSRRSWESYPIFRRCIIWFIRDLHLTWNGKDTCWNMLIITDHQIMEEFNFWRWSNSREIFFWRDYFEKFTRGIWLCSRFSVMSDRGILLCLFFVHEALDEVREEFRMRDLHSSRDWITIRDDLHSVQTRYHRRRVELDFQRRLVDERSDFGSSFFGIGSLLKTPRHDEEKYVIFDYREWRSFVQRRSDPDDSLNFLIFPIVWRTRRRRSCSRKSVCITRLFKILRSIL